LLATQGKDVVFPIRTMIIAAASVAASVACAADVPSLDVTRTCKPIANDRSLAIDTDRCLKTERQAREHLTRQWANYTEADRSQCTQTATMGGLPSYVELITCLEMKHDVAQPNRNMTDRPAALPKK
jgi:hypothetical protein